MKKIIALCLTVCMLCMVCPAAYADDKGLEQAILAVKAVIDIPEDHTEFNCYNYADDAESVWNFDWHSDDSYIDVTINSEGVILSYYFHDRTDNRKKWTDMTGAEAEEMAFDFVKKVNPELAAVLVLSDKNDYNENCEFAYAETINGIKLYNRMTYVTVNRVLKKVVNYSTSGKSKKTAASADGAITFDAATDSYAKNCGAEIIYEKKYNNKEKTISTYPVYKLKDTSAKAIHAVTGEAVLYNTSEKDAYRGGGSSNGALKEESALEDALMSSPGLSPEEIKAVEEISGLISTEDADKLIKGEFGVPENTNLHTYIEKDYYADKYSITLNYSGRDELAVYSARASVDAQTGKLLAWSEYKGDFPKGEAAVKSDEEIKAAADAFVSKYAAEDMKLCTPLEMRVSENTEEENKRFYFTAQRMANGAKVSGEQISLAFSADGAVMYFYNNITDYLEFDSIENAISEKAAIEKIASLSDYSIIYVYSSKEDKYIPVYEFENKYININPLTGEKINISEPAPEKPESYSDISGHWAEEIINSLLNNGYFIPGKAFEPDKAITVKEFLSFAKFVSERESDDNIALLIAKTEPEKQTAGEDIDVNGILSREIAARYITDSMGYFDIATHSEIFKYPFRDAQAAKENTGFISICYAKNILKGDSEGNFNPKKEMTRAEAAAAIYNYYSER